MAAMQPVEIAERGDGALEPGRRRERIAAAMKGFAAAHGIVRSQAVKLRTGSLASASGPGGAARLLAARHHHHRFAVEHDLAVDEAFAFELGAPALLDQLDDLDDDVITSPIFTGARKFRVCDR